MGQTDKQTDEGTTDIHINRHTMQAVPLPTRLLASRVVPGPNHRCKKRFFLFSKRFYFYKNVGKVQSGMQINKKHFQNNSNETDL